MKESPNVLFIVLDSVRAKNTSLHGHRNETTPFLETFSARATNYTQARSPGINSIASHTSIFTGHHVNHHGVERNSSGIKSGTTVWETLDDEYGYATGLFTPNVVLTESSNLASAFDFVETLRDTDGLDRPNKIFADAFGPTDIATSEGIRGNIDRSLHDDSMFKSLVNCVWQFAVEIEEGVRGEDIRDNIPAQDYVDPFFDWVDSRDGPWACCMNFMDAHQPYLPLKEYDKWGDSALRDIYSDWMAPKDVLSHEPWWKLDALESLYDGGIYQADQAVKQIIERLQDRDEFDNTLVVITSDHGEGFGERSFVEPSVRTITHSWSLNECLTHVPLIAKYPEQTESATVTDVVSLVNFPRVVENTVVDASSGDNFTSDKSVITYTGKLFEDELERVLGADESYLGPWRAVYESEDDVVKKYVQHHNSSATVTIVDAQTAFKTADSDEGKVESEFSHRAGDTVEIETAGEDVSEDVNQRLEDLGYI